MMNDTKMRDGMQRFYNEVSGREVFVIGGGPSFQYVDKKMLEGKLVVCINTAYKEFNNPTALYWCDESWVANHYDNIMKHQCPLRFTARHAADGHITKNILGTGNSIVLKRTGDFGIDTDFNHVKGNNSGAHVINLLANMKVRRIILLGYDLTMSKGKSHWHDGHGLPMANHIYNELFIPCLNSMADPLKNLKIDIVNCSVGTALKCFREDKLENYV
jgi:hypothetical protein